MVDNFLYIIGNNDQNMYKVGISNNPLSRIKGIQTGCPFPLSIIKKYKLNGHSSFVEKKIHSFLEKDTSVKSLVGEWFSCNVDKIDKLVQHELVDIKKVEEIKEQKERKKIEEEKIKLTQQKEELEVAMIPLFELQKNLDEKFKQLRKTESEIIQMTTHFEECRKKLNKNPKNKEVKQHYRDIITECLSKIRYMYKITSNPASYCRSYYDDVVSFFSLFRKRKIIEKDKRSYFPVNENGTIPRTDIIHNANFLDKRYLGLDEYDQFVLICKRKNYHGSSIIHFDKYGDYYLIENKRLSWGMWDRNFTFSTDELFGNHQAKSTYDKFLDHLEKYKGQLS
jgi:hypothetical protein